MTENLAGIRRNTMERMLWEDHVRTVCEDGYYRPEAVHMLPLGDAVMYVVEDDVFNILILTPEECHKFHTIIDEWISSDSDEWAPWWSDLSEEIGVDLMDHDATGDFMMARADKIQACPCVEMSHTCGIELW